MLTVTSPASINVITPAHMHISVEMLSNAGAFPNITVGAPAIHGAGVFGMHGIGVKLPARPWSRLQQSICRAEHIPNGIIFTIGTWSMIFASGI